MVRIGIIGDFNPKYHTHVAIEHTAAALGLPLHADWLPTPEIAKAGAESLLSGYHALWAAPASPYESGAGMLSGIEYARSHNVPFTGT